MVSRVLGLATAAGLLCCLVATPGMAQQNLDAGKSPGQLFEGNCSACHRSARGLLKTVPPSSLTDFLRQHYTTGGEMAQMLSNYLTSNRAGGDAGPSGKRGARQQSNLRSDAPVGTAAPDAGAGGEQEQTKGRKLPRATAETPDDAGGAEPTAPAGKRGRRHGRPDIADQPAGSPPQGEEPAVEGAGARHGAKGQLAKRGKRGQPPDAVEQPTPDVASKPDTPKEAPRSIDAAVPVPEPVVLPPPTAADIKPADVKPAEAAPVESKSTETKRDAPAAAAEKPAADKPADAPKPSSPAEAAVATPGSPAPPISR
jgi:hypothetical protein